MSYKVKVEFEVSEKELKKFGSLEKLLDKIKEMIAIQKQDVHL